jgi:1,4-dihydroxy-2-naphthoyl-CoA hydrolase
MTLAAGSSRLSDLEAHSDQRERTIEITPAAGPSRPSDFASEQQPEIQNQSMPDPVSRGWMLYAPSAGSWYRPAERTGEIMVDERARSLNEFGRTRLPGLLGMEILSCSSELVTGRIPVTAPLIAGTGFLWAPVVVALADTLCAYGSGENRPAGAESFTTIEMKTNFLGTVAEGGAICGEARPAHLGRTTQVWDAAVLNEATRKPIALFRCTQLILYPRAAPATSASLSRR